MGIGLSLEIWSGLMDYYYNAANDNEIVPNNVKLVIQSLDFIIAEFVEHACECAWAGIQWSWHHFLLRNTIAVSCMLIVPCDIQVVIAAASTVENIYLYRLYTRNIYNKLERYVALNCNLLGQQFKTTVMCVRTIFIWQWSVTIQILIRRTFVIVEWRRSGVEDTDGDLTTKSTVRQQNCLFARMHSETVMNRHGSLQSHSFQFVTICRTKSTLRHAWV